MIVVFFVLLRWQKSKVSSCAVCSPVPSGAVCDKSAPAKEVGSTIALSLKFQSHPWQHFAASFTQTSPEKMQTKIAFYACNADVVNFALRSLRVWMGLGLSRSLSHFALGKHLLQLGHLCGSNHSLIDSTSLVSVPRWA